MIPLDRISFSPLVRACSADDAARLAAVLDERRVAAGAVLMSQDDDDRDFFILLEGDLRLSRHGRDLGAVPRGAFVGEISLLTGRKRSATITAVSDVVLACLSHTRWQALRKDDPRLALAVAEAAAGTLADQLLAMTDSASLLFDGSTLPKTAQPRLQVVTGAVEHETLVHAGSTVEDVLPAQVDGADVVAALLGQRTVGLETPILADGRVTAITVATWEGREVWRRSAGLLFLAAARRVAPHVPFQLLHSVGAGRVVRCSVEAAALAPAIEAQMRALVAERALITREQWTVEEARSHFGQRGLTDAAGLLTTLRHPTVVVAGLDGCYVHAMGPALPTTASLHGIRVRPHARGLLLDYSEALGRFIDGATETLRTEEQAPRFASPMLLEHERWLAAMGVTSLGSFNEACVSGKVRDLIRVSEGFHEKHIGRLADHITERRGDVRVIAIAGPSSSGKTTFIKRLTVQLEVNGIHPVNLSLDDYYIERALCPRDEKGDYDFEALEALDLKTLQDHVRRLLAGEVVRTPHFDFKTGHSIKEAGPELGLRDRDVLLVEGIHGLNADLLGDAAGSAVFRIFVQPSLCLPFDPLTSLSPSDVRFMRRIVRDRHARGSRAEETILRWPSVRKGEGRHIYPHMASADAVFDTSLPYEMSVLKVYGERYLLEVPPSHPAFTTAYRLRHLLDRFVAIYPDHVPPTSMLREFIGGSGFEY